MTPTASSFFRGRKAAKVCSQLLLGVPTAHSSFDLWMYLMWRFIACSVSKLWLHSGHWKAFALTTGGCPGAEALTAEGRSGAQGLQVIAGGSVGAGWACCCGAMAVGSASRAVWTQAS
eukprot:CAMPEP_0180456692 /NCGR_PEP_ID=MMETSP1036_2-20121128/21437_1 /TAXON_ID=632150 /ORGANISM="Azadinium spinosum, Strain 3D9" /LENGTH=117 /DNA_ID=CAMNT_0022463275 /DNA_START=28 /DNA_END=381 /DNA_ORIENTATION=-